MQTPSLPGELLRRPINKRPDRIRWESCASPAETGGRASGWVCLRFRQEPRRGWPWPGTAPPHSEPRLTPRRRDPQFPPELSSPRVACCGLPASTRTSRSHHRLAPHSSIPSGALRRRTSNVPKSVSLRMPMVLQQESPPRRCVPPDRLGPKPRGP